MIEGTPKFNALVIGKIEADFRGQDNPIKLEATAAFVNTNTGNTHAWTDPRVPAPWSDNTLEKLNELRRLMEMDLAQLHLASAVTTTGPTKTGDGLHLQSGGIAEHVGTDATQV